MAAEDLPKQEIQALSIALVAAAASGKADDVKRLIAAGANVNFADPGDGLLPGDGATVLNTACRYGQVAIVETLIAAKAQVNRYDNYQKYKWAYNGSEAMQVPLMAACDADEGLHDEAAAITRLLLKHKAKMAAAHPEGRDGAIHLAAKHGHREALEILLQNGVDVNKRGRWGCTPLMHAADRAKSLELVKVLLAAKANINLKGPNGNTVLRSIIGDRDTTVDMVRLLIDHGADFKAYDTDYPPIIFAASHGGADVVQLLIQQGCRIDIRDRENRSPLDVAIQHKNDPVIKLLLKEGADPDARDRSGFGKDLIEYAADSEDQTLIGLVIDAQERKKKKNKGAPIIAKSGALALAGKKGNLAATKALLASGFDIDNADSDGSTGLMMAAAFGQLPVVNFLLEQRADLHARDKKGSTALHYAAAEGQAEAIEVLLAAGADVRQVNDFNWTALMQAAWKDKVAAAEILLKAGSPVDTIDYEKGANAWSLAGKQLRQLLEANGAGPRKIRERKPGEKLFLITECDICGYLPHLAELAHDWAPEEFPGLETIDCEKSGEYKADDTILIKRCIHCGSLYQQHHYIDTEDAIGGAGPVCQHSIYRIGILNQIILLRKLGKEAEAKENEDRYGEMVRVFLDAWQNEKLPLPNIIPYLEETLEEFFIKKRSWSELEVGLLRHKNAAYTLGIAFDLLDIYLMKGASRKYGYCYVGRYYSASTRDQLRPLLKANKTAFADCLKSFRDNVDAPLEELRNQVMAMAKIALKI